MKLQKTFIEFFSTNDFFLKPRTRINTDKKLQKNVSPWLSAIPGETA